MQDIKQDLQRALKQALSKLDSADVDIPVQEVPDNKPGDYGSPVAFSLAKTLRKNPAVIAGEIVDNLTLPRSIASAEAVGPYINFHVDPAAFVEAVVENTLELPKQGKKVIVEHTSINPNKEAHVGICGNIVLGDTVARILKAAGYTVEIQNYIDDTGRQAAESLFAIDYFKAEYDGSKKYDHWLGELYVKLTKAKESDSGAIEKGVAQVMHKLERGELRDEIAVIVKALLQTSYKLDAEYDFLVWESDVVSQGYLNQGLEVLKNTDYVSLSNEGKYAGALIMDVSEFIPGLKESNAVLVRSDGNAMYVAKDIGYHFWKAGIFSGLTFERFETQPSGHELYSSSPNGEESPDGHHFGRADNIVNVIDTRQEHEQTMVKAALKMTDHDKHAELHHLAYEVVTLEGEAMSGRKGITLAIDTVLDEAVSRAKAIVLEKNPDLASADVIANQVGVGALRFGMIKSDSKRIIDFRWEQALSLQGDSAPYIQYAHARACSILRAAEAEGLNEQHADWTKLSSLEVKLASVIVKLPEVILASARDLAPHTLAQYGLDLATAWNSYYNHKDEHGKSDTQVLRAQTGLREARLALVRKIKETLGDTLALMGIGAPEEM